MSLKADSGLYAMEELGLLDDALRASTVGSNGIDPAPAFFTSKCVPMPDANTPAKSKPNEKGVPPMGIRVVRHELRDMLLDAVPSNTTISWEKGCHSAHVSESDNIQVDLNDCSRDECNLLMAADGANNSIRHALLAENNPEHAGAICFQGTSRFPSGKPDPLKTEWGMNISGEGVSFFTFPIDHTTGAWGFTYKADKQRPSIKGDKATQRKDEILEEIKLRCKMFEQPFAEVVDATDPVTLQVFIAMHKSPISHAEQMPDANIVLIGDANHPMSPFLGNGANMALKDAVVLAQQLSRCMTVREAITKFDADSAPRSQKAIDRGKVTIKLLHTEGASYWLLRGFLAVMGFWGT